MFDEGDFVDYFLIFGVNGLIFDDEDMGVDFDDEIFEVESGGYEYIDLEVGLSSDEEEEVSEDDDDDD